MEYGSGGNIPKVYVLRLEQGKYYVGTSTQPMQRLAAHWQGTSEASAWTKKYKPVDIVQVIETDDALSKEDSTTIQYMNKFGIDNVRGGPYTKIILTPNDIEAIKHRLQHINNACFQCGSKAHVADQCPSKHVNRSHNGSNLVAANNASKKPCIGRSNYMVRPHCTSSNGRVVTCFRCHRVGHYANACNFRASSQGPAVVYERKEVDDDDCKPRRYGTATDRRVVTCFRCHLVGHYANACNFRASSQGPAVVYERKEVDDDDCKPRRCGTATDRRVVICFRCHQVGHYANACNFRASS